MRQAALVTFIVSLGECNSCIMCQTAQTRPQETRILEGEVIECYYL